MNRGPKCKKSENYYVMNNGRNYLRYYRVSRAILGRPPRTIGYFWKRCCGSCARVHRGDTCLQNWATGTRHTRGSNAWASRAYGSGSAKLSVATDVLKNCRSRVRCFVHPNPLLVIKKRGP